MTLAGSEFRKKRLQNKTKWNKKSLPDNSCSTIPSISSPRHGTCINNCNAWLPNDVLTLL